MRDRAFRLGVLNGALFEVVVTVMQPSLVLSAFFLKLTDSTFLAALPSALMHIGMLWPQLFVAHIAEGMPRKKPIYVWAGLARIVSLAIMALVAMQMTDADANNPIKSNKTGSPLWLPYGIKFWLKEELKLQV